MVVDSLSTAFVALSDPTRRLMIKRLARGPATVNELAEPFHISQQAISKHLAYLERAELIEKRQLGRQRVCALRPRALDEVITWVDQCKAFWEESFDQLQALVAEVKAQGNPPKGKARKKCSRKISRH